MSTFGKSRGGGRRVAQRDALPLPAVVTTPTQCQTAELVDVSSTGVRLRAAQVPPEGEYIQVIIECVRAFGTVMWVAGNECGVEFDSPMLSVEAERLRRNANTAMFSELALPERLAMEEWASGVSR